MPTPDEVRILAYVAIGLFILFVFLCWQMILRRRNEQKNQPTPVTEVGLKQYDELSPGYAVVLAWTLAPGDNERWHNRKKDEVREAMPVLARALDRMVEN